MEYIPIIAVMKACKCLTNGYEVLLAHAMENSDNKMGLPYVEVGGEYVPNDVLGLPPLHQLEFQFDLIPGVGLIAKAPYRLAPTEIKEMLQCSRVS